MSMWLEYAMVDEATFEKAKEDEGVCDAIFFADEAPAGVDRATQVIGLDYRTLSAMIEGMEEAGIGCDWTRRALGEEYGSELAFEFCYGPGFGFSPAEVKALAEGLAAEEWDPEDDYEENVARFFAKAAAAGKAVIGGVN